MLKPRDEGIAKLGRFGLSYSPFGRRMGEGNGVGFR